MATVAHECMADVAPRTGVGVYSEKDLTRVGVSREASRDSSGLDTDGLLANSRHVSLLTNDQSLDQSCKAAHSKVTHD